MPAAGPDKKLCGAQRMGQPPGVTCKRVAGAGTNHLGVGTCSRHLGNSENHKRAASGELARIAVQSLGLRVVPPMQPEEAILDELHQTINNVAYYEALVRELPAGEGGIYGAMRHVSGIATGEAKPHVLIGMLDRERDRKIKVAAEAIKANVTSRTIELAEGQARLVAEAFVLFALGMGWDPTSPEVRKAGSEALKQIRRGVVEGSATDLPDA